MKKQYRHERCINTYEGDHNKIVRASGLLQEMQEAGRLQMKVQKPSYEDLQNEGKTLMLSRLDMEVYEPVYVGETITVSSWPCESSRATFLRCYDIQKDGRVLAEIASQWALVDMESRKVLKTDEVDFSNYYVGEYKELYRGKLRIPKDESFEEVEKYKVRYSDLDSNGHMNNTYYLDVLSNHIPELAAGGYMVKSVRVHYSKEAPYGDVITVFRAKPDESRYIFKTVKESGELNLEAEIVIKAV